MRAWPVAWVVVFSFLGHVASAAPAWPKWLPAPPKLEPPPAGSIVVRTTAELERELGRAKANSTILLADGVYETNSILVLRAAGLTLRSASGDPARVAIDAGKCRGGEAIHIHADDVTIAEITIRNAKWNGIKLEPERGGHRFRAYGCVFHNIWQRGVKCPLVPADKSEHNPRDCRVEYCLFVNDRPKEFADDETDTPSTFNGNYIGGIDVKTIAGWTIAVNVFLGIQGRTREGRAAIYLADKCDDCIVERNVVIDCDVGIALGNPSRGGDWVHCTGCQARNNMIVRCPETGLLAVYTKDCRIVHNTVLEPRSRLGRLVWAHQSNDNLLIAGNLLAGAGPRVEGKGEIKQQANLAVEDAVDFFVDPQRGDLHLRSAFGRVVDAAKQALAPEDFDRQKRRSLTIGADEFQ